jgi:hypothetical protein
MNPAQRKFQFSDQTDTVPAVRSRTPTLGPELEIVRAFLERTACERRDGHTVTVFLEPRLESGYPDIVFVHWHRNIADVWPVCRAQLSGEDLRLLHFVHGTGRVARDDLRNRMNPRAAERALERLDAAGTVKVNSRWIRTRPLREIFAVRRIIALEAKISDWRHGLRQAFLNTWFASESFLLIPHVPKGRLLLEDAARLGLGVISGDRSLSAPQVRSRRDRLPRSYASWLFNEWVWRGFGTQSP